MSPETPTTQEIADNIVAQVESTLSETVPLMPKAFIRVIAKALAGVFVLLYKYAGFIFLQMFVAHASMRETEVLGKKIRPLVEWGRLIGAGDPIDATRAELRLTVTVLNQTGSLLAGAQLVFPSTGVVYLSTTSVALDAPTVEVVVRASSDQSGGGGAGAIGNLEEDDILLFASPLPNVSPRAVVLEQVVTGADGETETAYRARVTRYFQKRPQGGASADYQAWGEEDPGILHVYPYAGAPGEVDLYVEATVASSGSEDGIPTAAQLEAVAELVEFTQEGLASRRPVNAAVNVLPISRVTFDLTITGLDAPDIAVAEAAVEAAADEYFRAREPYIVGLSSFPRNDRVTLAAVSGAVDDAVSALGGTVASVVLELSGIPTPAYTLGDGEKAKLGTTTYV